jgi:hypothetical protein
MSTRPTRPAWTLATLTTRPSAHREARVNVSGLDTHHEFPSAHHEARVNVSGLDARREPRVDVAHVQPANSGGPLDLLESRARGAHAL